MNSVARASGAASKVGTCWPSYFYHAITTQHNILLTARVAPVDRPKTHGPCRPQAHAHAHAHADGLGDSSPTVITKLCNCLECRKTQEIVIANNHNQPDEIPRHRFTTSLPLKQHLATACMDCCYRKDDTDIAKRNLPKDASYQTTSYVPADDVR